MSAPDPKTIDMPESFDSERLTIRAPRLEDAEALFEAMSDSMAELRPWMPWAQTDTDLATVKKNIASAREKFLVREDLRLHLFLKGTRTCIGGSGLHRMDWSVPKFEIGYWVRSTFAGKGYVTEAVGAISDFAFSQLGAQRVEIRMSTQNERSWRVAERAGFELEGILRNNARHMDGSPGDTKLYEKVRTQGPDIA